MSTEAMKLALEAIQDLRGYRPDIDKAIDAIRTAIQQAEAQQPVTPEPVAWRVRRHDTPGYWIMFMHKPVDALQDSEREVQPLYTHPAQSVPDDVVRDAAQEAVEELHKLNEYAIVYINDPEWTRVSDTCQKLIGSIDAAMLAAKEAP